MTLRLCVCILGLAGLVAAARAEDKPATDPVAQGKDLVGAKKCSICHAIDGKGGKMGSLNGCAEGKTDEWLTGAILDPKTTLGEKTKMPSYKGKLTDDEVKAVVAYLKTLKK
jgi:cytochrome c oxidase subunit II